MGDTSIEWTDATWNPTRGCSLVSPGCTNCYAMKFAHRFSGAGQPYEGLTKLRTKGGPVWTGGVRFVPEQLGVPFGWKKPRRVFVNSMSDLFHLELKNEEIAAVFGVMAACPQHHFQILTKRPGNMLAWFDWLHSHCSSEDGTRPPAVAGFFAREAGAAIEGPTRLDGAEALFAHVPWPLPNVWLGVSVEDQEHALARIPLLLKTPATVRFLSAEPLLGRVELMRWLASSGPDGEPVARNRDLHPGIDWVIVGGESGPGARPMNIEWAREIIIDCREVSVPVFVKQLGAKPRVHVDEDGSKWGTYVRWPEDGPLVGATTQAIMLGNTKGGDPSEWPDDLRVREFPEEAAP